MIKQVLNVVPHAPIEDGFASMIVDETTGEGTVEVDIKAGAFGIVIKEEDKKSQFKVDPAMLLSKSLVAGLKISLGNAEIDVTNVANGKAQANFSVSGDVSLTGNAQIDVSQQYWHLDHVRASGNASGIALDVEMIA